MDILVRSWHDLAKFLEKSCQELQDVMVRSYQESHVLKKKSIAKSYLTGSPQKSTSMQIYIVRHDFL